MNNNNFQNNKNIQKIQKMFQNPEQFRTKKSLKYLISILFGLIPMIGAWIFLRAPGDVAFETETLFVTGINYGMMWLIAIGILVMSVIATTLFIKFQPEIKPDVFVPTITLTVFMSAFYLLPQLGLLVRIAASFGFLIAGGFISRLLLMVYIVYKLQAQFKKMKLENPETFADMANKFNQSGQNPFSGSSNNQGSDPYGYSDLPDTSKTSEYQDDEK